MQSENQNELVGQCDDCNASIFWDTDNYKFIMMCDCSAPIDPEQFPQWLRDELEV